MHGVLRSMLQKLNAYCISRRPMACLKARKVDDNERAAKRIAKRQFRCQQLPMAGSATSPNGGSDLAELASVSSSAAVSPKRATDSANLQSACRTSARYGRDLAARI